GCYALTFTNRRLAAQLEAQEKAHQENPDQNPAGHVFNGREEVNSRLESGDPTQRIDLNGLVKIRIKRPIFRAEGVDYLDPITGKEYKEVQRENEFGETVRDLEPLDQDFESIVVTTTPGRLFFNEILPYPLRDSEKYLQVELTKKAIATTIV